MAPSTRSKNLPAKAPAPRKQPRRPAKALKLKQFEDESQFMRIDQLSAGSAATPTSLNNENAPIHPIFAESNWPSTVSEKWYDAMKPSLRLASKFLTSKQIRPMLDTMLRHGTLQDLGERDKGTRGDRLISYPDRDCRSDRAISAAEIQHISSALDELATCVKIKTHDTGCETRHGLLGSLSAGLRHLQGVGSTIYVNRDSLRALVRAHHARPAKKDYPLLITKRFQFALELAHEVVHAFLFAVEAEVPDTDPFFGRDKMLSEIGFEAEDRLVGGTFSLFWPDSQQHEHRSYRIHKLRNGRLSALDGVPVVWRWPCRGTYLDYGKEGFNMWKRRQLWKAAPKQDIAWRVTVDDMHRYFTSSFWTRTQRDAEPESLHMPKKVGYPISFNSNGVSKLDTIDARELERQGIAGYHVTATYDIVMDDAD